MCVCVFACVCFSVCMCVASELVSDDERVYFSASNVYFNVSTFAIHFCVSTFLLFAFPVSTFSLFAFVVYFGIHFLYLLPVSTFA